MEPILHNKKVRLVINILLATLGTFFAFRFILPLMWPTVAGFLIARMILPVVRFLNEKMQFKKMIATILVLVVFVAVSTVAGWFICRIGVDQLKNLAENWNDIIDSMNLRVKNVCCGVENSFKLSEGIIYTAVVENFNSYLSSGKTKVISVIMNNSVPVLIKLTEMAAAIFVAIIAAFFFAKDEQKIKEWLQKMPFSSEFESVGGKLKHVFSAYLRAQFIIMLITMIICFISFTFIKNPYSLLLAFVVGMLDALPLFGIGVVLIPWSIVLFISGNAQNGVVLLITFVVCYILREILEPRLIGGRIGIPPILSLVTIYGGYKLFGIIGVILGPIAYVIISEIAKESSSDIE